MELEDERLRQCLRKVREVYQWHNDGLFAGSLRVPLLQWSQAERELGSYSPESRTLTLSQNLLLRPWGILVEVLKHEMAHQYVFEVLGVTGETAHGPTFRRICQQRGIDPIAFGVPKLDELELSQEELRIQERVRALLALSASENQHEAELAMATARRLMLKYNLDVAASAASEDYAFAHLGQPTGRRLAWQRVLANILTDHFFVEIIIVPVYRPETGKRGSVLEACGTRSNLAIATYVHDFLERAAEANWKSHKRARGGRSNADRQSFLEGLMCGFRDKLARESQKNQEQGLVWVGDPALSDYFRRRHPHVRHVGRSARTRDAAFSAGHAAGARIVLHRGVEAGTNGAAPRLLGAGGKG